MKLSSQSLLSREVQERARIDVHFRNTLAESGMGFIWTYEEVKALNFFLSLKREGCKMELNWDENGTDLHGRGLYTYLPDHFGKENEALLNWIKPLEKGSEYFLGGVTFTETGGGGVWVFLLKDGEFQPMFDSCAPPASTGT